MQLNYCKISELSFKFNCYQTGVKIGCCTMHILQRYFAARFFPSQLFFIARRTPIKAQVATINQTSERHAGMQNNSFFIAVRYAAGNSGLLSSIAYCGAPDMSN